MVPSVLALSFWNYELRDRDVILSSQIPSVCSIDYQSQSTKSLSLDYESFQSCEYNGQSTAGDLALLVTDTDAVDKNDVVLEVDGIVLQEGIHLENFRRKRVKVIAMCTVSFQSSHGELKVRLRREATLAEARNVLAKRMTVRADFIRFTKGERQINDREHSFSPVTVFILPPIHFHFSGQLYSLIAEYTIQIKDLRPLISLAIGDGVSPNSLRMLFERAELDDDMTLEDLDYGPQSAPLRVRLQ
jgi:hypothetical protein